MLEKIPARHEGFLGFFIKKQQEQEIPVKPTIEKLKKCELHPTLGLKSVTRNLGDQIARYICKSNNTNSFTFKVMH